MNKIEIIRDINSPAKRIFINGKDVSDMVTAVNFREANGTVGVVTLELMPSDIRVYEGALT